MAMLRYNAGKAPLSLVPSTFFEAIFNQAFENSIPVPTKLIWQVGQVLAFGAEKYSAHNWRKGGSWSSVLNSALRHLIYMIDGRRVDPESNLSEAGHLGCNIAFLLEFHHTANGDDDRHRVFFAPPMQEQPTYPSLIRVLDALLRFRDGGNMDTLREAAWELARWVEIQKDDESEPAAAPAPEPEPDITTDDWVKLPFRFPSFHRAELVSSFAKLTRH
jgi:hypothetical protein